MNKKIILGFALSASSFLPLPAMDNHSAPHPLLAEWNEAYVKRTTDEMGVSYDRPCYNRDSVQFPDDQATQNPALVRELYQLIGQTLPFKLTSVAEGLHGPITSQTSDHPEKEWTTYHASLQHKGRTFIIAQLALQGLKIPREELLKKSAPRPCKCSLLVSFIADHLQPHHHLEKQMITFAEERARAAGFTDLKTEITADNKQDRALFNAYCNFTLSAENGETSFNRDIPWLKERRTTQILTKSLYGLDHFELEKEYRDRDRWNHHCTTGHVQFKCPQKINHHNQRDTQLFLAYAQYKTPHIIYDISSESLIKYTAGLASFITLSRDNRPDDVRIIGEMRQQDSKDPQVYSVSLDILPFAHHEKSFLAALEHLYEKVTSFNSCFTSLQILIPHNHGRTGRLENYDCTNEVLTSQGFTYERAQNGFISYIKQINQK